MIESFNHDVLQWSNWSLLCMILMERTNNSHTDIDGAGSTSAQAKPDECAGRQRGHGAAGYLDM